MRIIVADDQTLFRAGLHLLLKQIFGAETEVFEAVDLAGLMAVLRDEPPADLVISDLLTAADDPFAALSTAIERANGVPVIIVSASQDREDVLRAMRCGASGYLVKREDSKVLRHVIELVLHGGRYIPPLALDELEASRPSLPPTEPPPARVIVSGATAAEDGPHPASRLTKRQAAIWLLLAEGRSNKEIARRLALDETTVKSENKIVYRKLGVRNRTQAALLAVDEANGDELSEAAWHNALPEASKHDVSRGLCRGLR